MKKSKVARFRKSMNRAIDRVFGGMYSYDLDEEGYFEQEVEPWYEKGTVTRRTTSRDCDGRYDTRTVYRFRRGKFHVIVSSQRDHSAEAMGY